MSIICMKPLKRLTENENIYKFIGDYLRDMDSISISSHLMHTTTIATVAYSII